MGHLMSYSLAVHQHQISRDQVPKVYFYCLSQFGSGDAQYCEIFRAKAWLMAIGIFCGEEFRKALSNSRKTTVVVMRRTEV